MRVAHGWNQRDAANAWNELWPERPKGDKDIGLWEIRRPGFATLDRLARLYGCSVADLIAGVGDYRHLDRANRPRTTTGRNAVHEDDEVERREFLGGAMASAARVVTPDALAALGSASLGSSDLDQLRSAVERATRLERAIPIELGDPATPLQGAEQVRFHLPAGLGERWARYLIDVARALVARRRDAEATEALLEAEAIAAEEVRSHRLTRSVLADLLARERRTSTPELRPLASRCGVLGPA